MDGDLGRPLGFVSGNARVPFWQVTPSDARARSSAGGEIPTRLATPWMDAVAKSVPKSEAKVVQGSGHFAMLEAAPQVNDAIAQFARRLS